jgi:GNAT superfamily N-acetyltransferase
MRKIEPEPATGTVAMVNNHGARVEHELGQSQPAADEVPDEAAGLVRRGKLPLHIRPATIDDLQDVLELIGEAKLWLPSKWTGQWSIAWADQKGRKRSDRVQASLEQGTTWVVSATYRARMDTVATVTIEPTENPKVWTSSGDREDSAVYLSRLVVARASAGLKIGGALLNWACDYALREHHVKLVRINVWTRNFALHKYYRKYSFRRADKCPDESYPSQALFQRSTTKKTRGTPRIIDEFSQP